MKKKIVEIKSTIVGIFAGIILGVVLTLTGCGKTEDLEASTGRVVERIDDEGNVVAQVDITEEGLAEGNLTEAKPTEEKLDDEKQIEDKLTEEGLSEDATAETIDDAPTTVTKEVIQSSTSKDYLKYMSEEELQALAVEALQKEGYDTRLAEGRMKTKGIDFDIPQGFEANENVEGMYVTGRYPLDATNIYVAESDVDYTLQLMDQEYFKELLTNSMANILGQEIEINITEFTRMMISAVPTFKVVAEMDVDDIHLIQQMFVINGSKTYNIVYTQTNEYDREGWFDDSINSIRVKR